MADSNETLQNIIKDVIEAGKKQGCISQLPKTGYHTGSIASLLDEDK